MNELIPKTAMPTGRQPRRSAITVMPPEPRTNKGMRRKQALIEAAAQLVDQIGYDDLSISKITAAVDAPVGLYYRYFRNKTDAVLAALSQSLAEYSKSLSAAVEASDFFEGQVHGFALFETLFREHPGLLSCYYSYDYGEPAFADFFHDRTVGFDRLHLERTAKWLGTEVRRKDLFPVAHILIAMVDTAVFRMVTKRDDIEVWLKDSDARLDQLIAAMRYRVYTLQDAPQAAGGLSSTCGPGRPGVVQPLPPISLEPLFRRMPKRADSSETLEKLLDATLELLNRHSLDDMRLTDVEQHTGATRGVIYHYFEGKRDLAWAAIEQRLHALLGAIAKIGEQTSDAEETLASIIVAVVSAYERNPGLIRTVYHLENSGPESPRLRQYRSALARSIGDILFKIMAERDRSPALANVLAYLLLATIDRVCYDMYVVPFRELTATLKTKKQVAALLTFMFTRMYLKREPAAAISHPAIRALRATTLRDGQHPASD